MKSVKEPARTATLTTPAEREIQIERSSMRLASACGAQ